MAHQTEQERKGGRDSEMWMEEKERERESIEGEKRRKREHQKIGECVMDGRETN